MSEYQPYTREELEEKFGKDNVWNTEEATKEFEFKSFFAPFAFVRRISDNKEGALTFQHMPRFYYDFR
jgi:pterin-4a-carbinolamine dehydratase